MSCDLDVAGVIGQLNRPASKGGLSGKAGVAAVRISVK